MSDVIHRQSAVARCAAPLALPPLSLYVHFPWCARKCPYCDFNSYSVAAGAAASELPEALYIDALLQDLASECAGVQGRPLQSVFLGGGTPSLFSPAALARLLEGCRALCPFAADAEITLEANPGTVERGRFAEYRAAGITRVSLGAQSFSDAHLRALGRIHCAAETQRAAAELHAAGLNNFNLDLMYALPQQSIEQACADIRMALALAPMHISHYQLTLEPGTVFGARPPAGLPDQDGSADMQRRCQEQLAQGGFTQYEVSAYARPGASCQHNLNYWRFGDYLGIGAGAHGKASRRERGTLVIERSTQPREPRRYLRRHLSPPRAGAPIERHRVAKLDLPFEYTMNTLRLREGFRPGDFEARTGLLLAVLHQPLTRAAARGLIEYVGDRWRASARGFDFLNDLVTEFLPVAPHRVSVRPTDEIASLSSSTNGARAYAQRGGAGPTN